MNANPPSAPEIPSPALPPGSEAPAVPVPAAPSAAALVTHGEAGEEVLRLRRELESERAARRKAETEASEAERKAQELIAVTQLAPETPLPAPTPPRRRFPTMMNHPWK